MRFDPKLISPEPPPLDAAGELLLPDDLGELAAQLSCDAEHLAAVYPAQLVATVGAAETATPNEALHLRRTSWRLVQAIAAVACVGGLLTGGAWWWPPAEPASEVANHVTSPVEITQEQPEPAEFSPPEAAPPAPASPSLFLHEYSGPEVEGLYDLIGEQEDGTISI